MRVEAAAMQRRRVRTLVACPRACCVSTLVAETRRLRSLLGALWVQRWRSVGGAANGARVAGHDLRRGRRCCSVHCADVDALVRILLRRPVVEIRPEVAVRDLAAYFDG